MKSHLRPLVLLASLTAVSAWAAPPDDDPRATFDRFVAAQNAHDLKAVEALLLDSPQFLWITRGTPVWGRAEALKRFEALYAGTWHLEPESAAFRVVFAQPQVAELFVPIVFSIGPAGQPAQETRFLMNQVLVKSDSGWKIASILPIPAPPPAK
ncbi:MAG: nuclear transport factor 2 family protein [Acidobacteriota bacterium]